MKPECALCMRMCTHPNPGMGPLYMPDERREEYAADAGLKRPPPHCWRLLPSVATKLSAALPSTPRS